MAEKITYIKRDTTDREGNALKTKDGRPYTRMSLKVESKGDKYISGFGNAGNAAWGVGDDVEITIVEAPMKDKNGVPYLNFTQPKKEDKIDEKLEMILNRFVGIQLQLNTIIAHLVPQKKTQEVNNDFEYPENDGADLPF